MEALEMDQYSRRSTLFRFDPRVKFAGTIAFIVATSFLRDINALLVALASVLVLAAISRLPPLFILKAYVLTVPFILFFALTAFLVTGPPQGLAMGLRISASVLALLLLVTTTPFFELLKGLRWFRVPKVICSLLLFTYRYLFVLLDEMQRMSLARKARGFTGKGNIGSRGVLRTISFTAGMVLVRSYQRALRIYEALMSRGYDGEIRTIAPLKARARDAALLAWLVGSAVLALSVQAGVIAWR